MNCVEYLTHRRERHTQILSEHSGIEHLKEVAKNLDYVMSVHTVHNTQEIDLKHHDNLLMMMAQPSILGITDLEYREVTSQTLDFARQKLNNMHSVALKSSDLMDTSVDSFIRIFASWSNIVGSCIHKNELETLTKQMRDIQFELQHLWFYFDQIRKGINKAFENDEDLSAMSRMRFLADSQIAVCA
ncbi:MAG: hypothetical protein ACLFP2_04230, partial [Candidatus Woesearchaeota archaeon]